MNIYSHIGLCYWTTHNFPCTYRSATAPLIAQVWPSEQNAKDFILQHSTNGNTRAIIASLPASGNSSVNRYYCYVHNTPAPGNNYYCILQTDLDGRYHYSKIRTLRFSNEQAAFKIISNPAINSLLQIQVINPLVVSLYNADGKLH